MALHRPRTKSATVIPVRNAWSATPASTVRGGYKRPGTAIGTCRRTAFSAISPRPPSQSEARRMTKRSLSADSLFLIPQTQSLESEFQAVLGKTLFEKSVNVAEENIMAQGDSVIRWTDRPLSHSADTSPAAMRRSGPPVFQYRSSVAVRPTRTTTPLVNKNQSFRTYFPKGSIDTNAVAKAHGLVGHPTPNITPQIHRIRSATNNNLRNFSLKQEYNDIVKETARERYWKRRAQLKVLEECIKMDVIDELLANADEMIARREEERAAAARAEAERLAELERIELEKKRLEEERLARLIEDGAQTTITYIEEMKNAEKAPKGKKGKKGKRGKGKKSASSGGGKSAKGAKKKKKTPKGADDDYDPETIPASILKDERLGSAGSEGSKKRVRFREKLTSTKTIGGSRSSSPKGKRSSGGKKKKGKGKKGKSKADPVVIPVEPPKPEPPPEVPPEPPIEVKPEEPKEPIVIQLDDPPEFIPAEEYRTKNQMVEDWLNLRTIKMSSKTQSLLIDLS